MIIAILIKGHEAATYHKSQNQIIRSHPRTGLHRFAYKSVSEARIQFDAALLKSQITGWQTAYVGPPLHG